MTAKKWKYFRHRHKHKVRAVCGRLDKITSNMQGEKAGEGSAGQDGGGKTSGKAGKEVAKEGRGGK